MYIILFFDKIIKYFLIYIFSKNKRILGDWGLGIGDWGLGIGPNPQFPIPNPQSPLYLSFHIEFYY